MRAAASPIRGELLLQIAVLEAALVDATSTSQRPAATLARNDALLWFVNGDRGMGPPFTFNGVCDSLRLSPTAVREQVVAAQSSGRKIRLAGMNIVRNSPRYKS